MSEQRKIIDLAIERVRRRQPEPPSIYRLHISGGDVVTVSLAKEQLEALVERAAAALAEEDGTDAA
jgi:hypothetical protein